MDDNRLEKALRLKEEIKDLKRFLDHMSNHGLWGEVKVEKSKAKGLKAWIRLKVNDWNGSERVLKLNRGLLNEVLMLACNELKRLEDEYEKL